MRFLIILVLFCQFSYGQTVRGKVVDLTPARYSSGYTHGKVKVLESGDSIYFDYSEYSLKVEALKQQTIQYKLNFIDTLLSKTIMLKPNESRVINFLIKNREVIYSGDSIINAYDQDWINEVNVHSIEAKIK